MYLVPIASDFDSDFYTVVIDESYKVVFNSVQEYFNYEGRSVVIDEIQIRAYITDGVNEVEIQCPNIVGLSNEILELHTDDPSLLGSKIQMNNLGQWGVTINE